MSRESKHGKVIINGTRKGLASFITFFAWKKQEEIILYGDWFQGGGLVAQIKLY